MADGRSIPDDATAWMGSGSIERTGKRARIILVGESRSYNALVADSVAIAADRAQSLR
jgi:hypothetical protein